MTGEASSEGADRKCNDRPNTDSSPLYSRGNHSDINDERVVSFSHVESKSMNLPRPMRRRTGNVRPSKDRLKLQVEAGDLIEPSVAP